MRRGINVIVASGELHAPKPGKTPAGDDVFTFNVVVKTQKEPIAHVPFHAFGGMTSVLRSKAQVGSYVEVKAHFGVEAGQIINKVDDIAFVDGGVRHGEAEQEEERS